MVCLRVPFVLEPLEMCRVPPPAVARRRQPQYSRVRSQAFPPANILGARHGVRQSRVFILHSNVRCTRDPDRPADLAGHTHVLAGHTHVLLAHWCCEAEQECNGFPTHCIRAPPSSCELFQYHNASHCCASSCKTGEMQGEEDDGDEEFYTPRGR